MYTFNSIIIISCLLLFFVFFFIFFVFFFLLIFLFELFVCIYRAVVESRKIFRKLKSYAIYRVAATIQIVFVLTLLIYVSNCTIQSIYIVLLALFNDITLLPIAYDYQVASKQPESPNVRNLLILATILGCCQTAITMFFAYGIPYISIFQDSYSLTRRSISLSGCDEQTQSIIWIQVFIATEILAFSTRAPTYFFLSVPPTWPLTAGIFIGCLIICLIASFSSPFGSLPSSDVALVWVWDIFWLFVIDAIKVQIMLLMNESTEVLPDLVIEGDVITSAKSIQEISAKANQTSPTPASATVVIPISGSKIDENSHSIIAIGIEPPSNFDSQQLTIDLDSPEDVCSADDLDSYAFKQRELSQLGKLVISDGSTRSNGLGNAAVQLSEKAILVRGFARSSSSMLSSTSSF